MIEFIDTSPTATLAALVADYEARTGKVLNPGQAEYAVLSSCAYLLSLHKMRVNEAANQMLVNFSDAPALDELGRLVGVQRLQATPAKTTIQFILVAGHGGVTIPAGTRVATVDGQAVFATVSDISVIAGVNVASGEATASESGEIGNGYFAGNINLILDPQAYLESATNLTDSAGGSDEETDEQLRDRIKLAPSSFSTAGPVGAYKYWAFTASALIIDVAVISPAPGTVNVYPLVEGAGTTPTEILEDVEAILTDEKIRPLTDTVNVLSPTTINYDIEVNVTLYDSAEQATTQTAIEASLQAYADSKLKLGQDIKLSQIIGACTAISGVYDVEVASPIASIDVDPTEVALCSTITVNIVGTNPG